jgi:hypothetical protein
MANQNAEFKKSEIRIARNSTSEAKFIAPHCLSDRIYYSFLKVFVVTHLNCLWRPHLNLINVGEYETFDWQIAPSCAQSAREN